MSSVAGGGREDEERQRGRRDGRDEDARTWACGRCGRATSPPGRRAAHEGTAGSRGRRAGLPAMSVWVPSALSPEWKMAHGTQSRSSELLAPGAGPARACSPRRARPPPRPRRPGSGASGRSARPAARRRGRRPGQREQDAPHLPVGQGAEPPLLRSHADHLRSDHEGDPRTTSPARNGRMQAAARASVRRASVPGAVPTASTATSVDRVSRAARSRLVRPMKKAPSNRDREHDRDPGVVVDEDDVSARTTKAESDADQEDRVAGEPAGLDDGHRAVTGEAGRGHGKTAHGAPGRGGDGG